MKAKKYAKEQIAEAIQFWKKILENKSPLLDSLIDDFGYGVVFNGIPTPMTLKTYEKLFDKANNYLFSRKLVKWPFVVDDQECNASNALCGYVNSLISNIEKQRYDVVTEDCIVCGELYKAPHYAFKSIIADGHSYALMMAMSLLVHEMIHQFNYECEDEGAVQWPDIAYGRTYDPHGKNFMKMMDNINARHGLSISKFGFGSLDQLQVDAIDKVKSFARHDYKNESSNGETIYGHTILKHNEDYSAFTQFV